VSTLRLALRSFAPFLVALPVFWLLGGVTSEAWTFVAVIAAINVILAVSLNVVNGFTGQIGRAHV